MNMSKLIVAMVCVLGINVAMAKQCKRTSTDYVACCQGVADGQYNMCIKQAEAECKGNMNCLGPKEGECQKNKSIAYKKCTTIRQPATKSNAHMRGSHKSM